jgi:sortase A
MHRKFALGLLEKGLLVVGLMLLAVFLGLQLHSRVSSRVALRQFTELSVQKSAAGEAQVQPGPKNAEVAPEPFGVEAGERQSPAVDPDAPIAVLTIPKIALKVPVFNGTEELTLNRGVGRIIGTAKPGQGGNIGIAGHRDGFFLGLKDIRIGDRIELETPDQRTVFAVDSIKIVLPEDVGVLKPSDHPMLTLVTCYPFYYIGHAPKRYIVRAAIAEPAQTPAGVKSSQIISKNN